MLMPIPPSTQEVTTPHLAVDSSHAVAFLPASPQEAALRSQNRQYGPVRLLRRDDALDRQT